MSELNEQQMEVVNSTASKILVLAGAGAGKTHTMLARINELIRCGESPRHILVLTFTNKAAFDMKERYKQNNKNRLMPEFRTFHSFCYHLLVSDTAVRNELGYSQPPTVCNDATLKNIETKAKMQIGCKLSNEQIRDYTLCKTARDQASYKLLAKNVRRLLKADNLITFQILAEEVTDLFVSDSPLIKKYKDRYKYIFVDEFQDTDPQQVKFIESFHNTNFCVIGDSLQCIYQFRGCSNATIKQYATDDSWKHIRLSENYRSTVEICEFANNMSTYADSAYRIKMNGHRHGDKVTVISGSRCDWDNPVDEYHTKMLIDRLKSRKTGDKDVAVLCRTNKEVQYICQKLKDNQILYSSGKRNEDSLNILKSVYDNEFMLDWLSSFLTAEKYAEYIRLAAQQENPDVVWFATEYKNVPEIQERGKTIVAIRQILRNKKPIVSKVGDIFKVLGIKAGELKAIEKEEDIIPDLISLIEDQGDQDIYVGTIHSSKGLEYDTVYIMGVNDRSFRLGEEDMNNLYYVAITRAKNHLTIFSR